MTDEQQETEVILLDTRQLKTIMHESSWSSWDDMLFDPSGHHYVAYHMANNDTVVRMKVLCKMRNNHDPRVIWLDIPMETFNRLPRATINKRY